MFSRKRMKNYAALLWVAWNYFAHFMATYFMICIAKRELPSTALTDALILIAMIVLPVSLATLATLIYVIQGNHLIIPGLRTPSQKKNEIDSK